PPLDLPQVTSSTGTADTALPPPSANDSAPVATGAAAAAVAASPAAALAPPSPGPAGEVAPIVTALPAADSRGLYLTLIAAGGLAVVLSRLLGRLAVVPSRRRSRS